MDLLKMVVKKRSQDKTKEKDMDSLKRFSARVGRLRGEGALATSEEPEVALEVVSINIHDIEVPAHFPRKAVGDIQPLVASIKVYGIQQPLKVVKIRGSKKFSLVFGHRRMKAAQVAGFDAVPCVVELVTREDRLVMLSLAENIQRGGLNPIEEASSYRHLIKNGSSPKELCNSLGRTPEYIKEVMDFLSLPESVCLAAMKNPDKYPFEMLRVLLKAYKKSKDDGKKLFDAVSSDKVANFVEAENFIA